MNAQLYYCTCTDQESSSRNNAILFQYYRGGVLLEMISSTTHLMSTGDHLLLLHIKLYCVGGGVLLRVTRTVIRWAGARHCTCTLLSANVQYTVQLCDNISVYVRLSYSKLARRLKHPSPREPGSGSGHAAGQLWLGLCKRLDNDYFPHGSSFV